MSDETKIDAEALRKQIAELQRSRIKACWEKLQPILKEFGCKLIAEAKIERGLIVATPGLSVEE